MESRIGLSFVHVFCPSPSVDECSGAAALRVATIDEYLITVRGFLISVCFWTAAGAVASTPVRNHRPLPIVFPQQPPALAATYTMTGIGAYLRGYVYMYEHTSSAPSS